MSRITDGKLSHLPFGPSPGYRGGQCPNCYAEYLNSSFSLTPCLCEGNCLCKQLGCVSHWQWNPGLAPRQAAVDRALWCFGAYQGPGGKQPSFRKAFVSVIDSVASISRYTIACNWEHQAVQRIYGEVSGLLQGSVLTTKTLHFLAPDFFLILDRQQVYKLYHYDYPVLPRRFNELTARSYVGLLEAVRADLASVVKAGNRRKLKTGYIALNSLSNFRLVSPHTTNQGLILPGTLGKVIDNIMRG